MPSLDIKEQGNLYLYAQRDAPLSKYLYAYVLNCLIIRGEINLLHVGDVLI